MMRGKSTPAKFGPQDAEGFRTVSFYGSDGSEVLKLSLHLERQRQQFTSTAAILDYSENEQAGLKTAARIASARKESSVHDPGIILAMMLDLLIPKFVTEQTEKLFPELARIALQAVQDACVKFAISGVVEMNNAPRIYGEETADWILRDLTATIRNGFLGITAGRPAEVQQQLDDTREALKRIEQKKAGRIMKKPTQQQVANELGISGRALRNWPRSCNLTWDEWVTASQWETIEKAKIPDEWLGACGPQTTENKAETN